MTEDYVVDVVLDVGSRGVDREELARRVSLPGVTLQRAESRGTMWLTALVAAPDEATATRAVRESILTQFADVPDATAAALVTGVALGELYARLDVGLADEELEHIDVRDLVREQMWEREPRGAPRPRRGRRASA